MVYFVVIGLIVCSALFSGLTLGLMGLDAHVLKRKMKLGDSDAAKIYPLRKNGNLLLTTLLLGNVAVNSVLAIFLGSIASGVVAGLVSTALIFLFGEIIPQAVISRHAMAFGARTAWLVWGMIFIAWPIARPIAWILDRALGSEMPSVYSRGELISVIEEHEDSEHSDVDADEERIIKGALVYSNRTVGDVMTPGSVSFFVDKGQKLSASFVKKLRESGHSRFPVFDGREDNVVGMLYLRTLVGRTLVGKTVKDFYERDVHFVKVGMHLDDVLNMFIRTHRHLFVVVDEFGTVDGLISVEDVMEEIIGVEIVDEFDKFIDLRKVALREAREVEGVDED